MSQAANEKELQVFGMIKADQDGYRLCESEEEPEFYDILYTENIEETGEIKTLEEHEDLSFEDANKKVAEMEASTGLMADWLS